MQRVWVVFLAILFGSAPFSLHADDLNPARIKIAVCYWGLTRSTKVVYTSHYNHLFSVLDEANIEYDVFMHTWHTNNKQRVWDQKLDIPIDYEEYKLLHPAYYQIDNQEAFGDTLVFSNYFDLYVWNTIGDHPRGEWWPSLIFNHLCALESQKRVTNMVLDSHNHYDFIMYVRPDALLKNPFPIHMVYELGERDVMIPDFDQHEGYNDRFALLHTAMAPVYGKRIDEIVPFRQTQGRIVSEKYVKYICDKYGLTARLAPFYFDLIRPGGA